MEEIKEIPNYTDRDKQAIYSHTKKDIERLEEIEEKEEEISELERKIADLQIMKENKRGDIKELKEAMKYNRTKTKEELEEMLEELEKYITPTS